MGSRSNNGNHRVQKIAETSTFTVRVTGLAPDVVPGATFSAAGPSAVGPFTLDDSPSSPAPDGQATPNLVPGTYTIAAPDAVAGHLLKSVTCTNGASGEFGATSLPVNVKAGQSVTCT